MMRSRLLFLLLVINIIFIPPLSQSVKDESDYVNIVSTTISNPNYNFTEVYNGTINPQTHPIKLITWPLSTYPALVEWNSILSIELTESINNVSIILNNRPSQQSYLITADNQINSSVFNFTITNVVSAGLYDVILLNSQNEFLDIQTHAVKIFETAPKPIRFAQLSDTHIPIYPPDKFTIEALTTVFNKLEAVNPNFAIITGDFVTGAATYIANSTTGIPPIFSYEEMIQIALDFIDQFQVAIFVTSGNHDWMKVYPNSTQSRGIWENYLGNKFTQFTSISGYDFIGFNTKDAGLTSGEFAQVESNFYTNPTNPKILYAHYDFDLRVKKSVPRLHPRIFLQGHDHVTKQYFVNDTLYLMIYNAFELEKTEPLQGFHNITIWNDYTIEINGVNTTWTREVNNTRPIPITTSEPSTTSSTFASVSNSLTSSDTTKSEKTTDELTSSEENTNFFSIFSIGTVFINLVVIKRRTRRN